MSTKVPWTTLYAAFRQKFPNWRNQVMHWEPYDFMKILLECKNGKFLIYDHTSGVVKIMTKEMLERKKTHGTTTPCETQEADSYVRNESRDI